MVGVRRARLSSPTHVSASQLLKVNLFLLLATILLSSSVSLARTGPEAHWASTIESGIEARNRGNIQLSIGLLNKAWEAASSLDERTRAAAELGASLLQARRLDDAEEFLKIAYANFSYPGKASVALDLGNLAVARKNNKLALQYYLEAETNAGESLATRISAALNRARIGQEVDRLSALAPIIKDIENVASLNARARLYLNLGLQAKQILPQGLALAYQSIHSAYTLAPKIDKRLALEAFDALAQLYEDQGRTDEAKALTRLALTRVTAGKESVNVQDILVRLEWRDGRLLRREGRTIEALAAYQNAAMHLEGIRQDIPIEYENGRSSFQETLRPVFTGLADVTLIAAANSPGQEQKLYRQAIHALELTKQSEMQDYLGDRCSVDAVGSGMSIQMPARTAALYPILFDDRVELLLETNSGIVRRTSNIGGAAAGKLALTLAKALPNYSSRGYLSSAQQLYDAILRPIEGELAKQNIETLIVVSDGPLRLVPIGALHDGEKFAIERFAVTTVTGLSMTDVQVSKTSTGSSLLAGLSEPGTVVSKLTSANVESMLTGAPAVNPTETRSGPQVRSIRSRGGPAAVAGKNEDTARVTQLKEMLALPGAKEEIQSLGKIMPNVSMLNEAFTLEQFGKAVGSGDYRILHIASHGVFGGDANSSYIMTYDDLLTMNRMDFLLRDRESDTNPIELLTLSACETAEGNERSPLGFSGAAIKAKAKSVIGTLWPVGDEAARKIMEKFYEGYTRGKLSKSAALRNAQRELLRDDNLSHPFFWAPFVVIGNWM